MTISSEVRKAGPYVGNGVATAFPFSFKVFSADHVVVVLTDPAGAETVLTSGTDYSVALNANQETAPGGTVNKASPLATGYLLTLTSNVPGLQPLDLTNQGGFYPEVINTALDRLTILAQQNAEQIGRAIKVQISSSTTPDALIAQLTQDASTAAAAASSASASATAAGNSATSAAASEAAAGNSATSAAASEAAAGNSATSAAASEAAAGNSATSAAASATAAGNSATSAAASATAAGNSATAAGSSASSAAASATAAAESYDSFDDRYLGAKTANPATDNDGNALLVGALYWNSTVGEMRAWDGTAWQVAYSPTAGSFDGLFYKADPATVVFIKTGAGTASIKAGTKVDVAGTTVTFSTATSITMPTLVAGTDYAIWVKDDATIEATANFSTAPGTGNWRKIGGFHYAPGGNASAQAGGDAVPQINEYSFWDLKFRPACPDPRGMTLVANSFWADIYLLGVNHYTNGTSRYNVAIAKHNTPPKIPAKFGGNGTAVYTNMDWWTANEVLQSWGKRSPTYNEFAALAYGTTEATSSGGSDTPTTGANGTGATNGWNKFTSRWGVIQSTGCLGIWGNDFGGGAAGAAWTANTNGRGSTYQMEYVAFFGGYFNLSTEPGSRCSMWGFVPGYSLNYIGARGVCDHLMLD